MYEQFYQESLSSPTEEPLPNMWAADDEPLVVGNTGVTQVTESQSGNVQPETVVTIAMMILGISPSQTTNSMMTTSQSMSVSP